VILALKKYDKNRVLKSREKKSAHVTAYSFELTQKSLHGVTLLQVTISCQTLPDNVPRMTYFEEM
jgi:hypothetical protein